MKRVSDSEAMAKGTMDAQGSARRDPADMLGAVARFPEWWQEAVANGLAAEAQAPEGLRHVVVLGMGGSGITGDVVRAAMTPQAEVPVFVVKGYDLPEFVGPGSLVLAVSYSGNTEETLDAMGQAMESEAHIVGLTSGGRLAAACDKHGWPLLRVPEGVQPRAALPFLSGTALGFLQKAGILEALPDASRLAPLRDELMAEGDGKGAVTSWARALANASPVAYGWREQSVAALRFKCQLNENAKIFARHEDIPESNHNDLVAWGSLRGPGTTDLCLFRASREPKPVAARFRFLEQVAREHGVPIREFRALSDDLGGGMLESILFGDVVSVHTAFARGVDPTPVDVISRLKSSLAGQGTDGPAIQRLGL